MKTEFGHKNNASALMFLLAIMIVALPITAAAQLVVKYASSDPAIPYSTKMLIDDVNGDGASELVTVESGQKYEKIVVSAWKNDKFSQLITTKELGFIYDIASGDLNDDKIKDIVATGLSNSVESIFICIYNKSSKQYDISVVSMEMMHEQIVVLDIDMDGTNEIVASSVVERGEESSKEMLKSYKYSANKLVENWCSSDHYFISDMCVCDTNGDGKDEIIVGEHKKVPGKGGDRYLPIIQLYVFNGNAVIINKEIKYGEAQMSPYPKLTKIETEKSCDIYVSELHKVKRLIVQNDKPDAVLVHESKDQIKGFAGGNLNAGDGNCVVINELSIPSVASEKRKKSLKILSVPTK